MFCTLGGSGGKHQLTQSQDSPSSTPVSRGLSRGSESRSGSASPAGLKTRLALLEKLATSQSDEIGGYKLELANIRKVKDRADQFCDAHLLAVEKNLISEIEKTREEMMRQLAEQKAELARFGTQVRALKAEKTVLQNQVAALQRRIVNIDEEIGQE